MFETLEEFPKKNELRRRQEGDFHESHWLQLTYISNKILLKCFIILIRLVDLRIPVIPNKNEPSSGWRL